MLKSDKVHKFKELKEISLAIMSKPHAYPQTMKKTHTVFQNNLHKIVIGVALTRHPLFILFVCLILFFTSHQQSFSYIETGLPRLNQY